MDSEDTLPREMPALIEYATKEAAVAPSLKSLQGEDRPRDWRTSAVTTGPAFICWTLMTQRRSF